MISCKKASELISKSMDGNLSLKDEFELKVHLFICEFCEAFKKQAILIREALRRQNAAEDNISENLESFTKEAKERLKTKLKSHAD